MTSIFKNIGSDAALALAAKESTFAYHAATHGQSSDCTSKLVSKLFEPKFSLGNTKCEAIVVNVIALMCTDQLYQQSDGINFVAVTIDASKMKEVKLVPIVVLYFLPESGVKVKLLEFKSVPGEIAEIFSKYLHDQNVKALLVCKSNIDLTCTEFYENIKSNVVLLKKVLGIDKYH